MCFDDVDNAAIKLYSVSFWNEFDIASANNLFYDLPKVHDINDE